MLPFRDTEIAILGRQPDTHVTFRTPDAPAQAGRVPGGQQPDDRCQHDERLLERRWISSREDGQQMLKLHRMTSGRFRRRRGPGVCTLLANHGNRHHGPGLNQGISYLASRPGPRPEWIWILDSDVVAARPDALSAAAATAREHSAALVGEPQHDQWHPDGRFGM